MPRMRSKNRRQGSGAERGGSGRGGGTARGGGAGMVTTEGVGARGGGVRTRGGVRRRGGVRTRGGPRTRVDERVSVLSALPVCDVTVSRPKALETIFCGPMSAWPKGKTLEVPLRLRAKSSTADSAGSSEMAITLSPSPPLPLSTADSAGSSEMAIALSPSPPLPFSTADSAGSSEMAIALSPSPPLPSSTADSAGGRLSRLSAAETLMELHIPLCSNPPSPAANVEIVDRLTSSPSTSSLRAVRLYANRVPVPITAVPAPALHCPAPRRPLRDNEIEKLIFYGSDESGESGDSGGDDEELQPLILPKVLRPYYESDEDSDSEHAASLVVEPSWPPTRQITVPASAEPPAAASSEPSAAAVELPSAVVEPPAAASLEPPAAASSEPSAAAVELPSAVVELPAATMELSEASVLPPGACFPQKFDFQWRPFPQPQVQPELRRETFSESTGPTALYADPYDAFVAIWDRPIVEYIARETNKYAQEVAEGMVTRGITPNSRITRWKDTSADELYAYFAIIQATGIVIKSHLEEYWNSSKDIFSTPEFSANMSYDRFCLLSRCLHFNNNDLCNPESMAINEAKLFKVRPIVQHLNNKFASLYVLGRNIALDESLTQWTGRLNIRQHIPNKAAAVGIKTYEICESETGYLWRFEVEARQSSADTQDINPISGKIPSLVLRLLHGLEHKGYTVWMDNYYNSPALARELKLLGFDCVGTLRTNRQLVPAELTNLKAKDMAVGHVCGCTSGDVDIIVWRDKKRIALITTYHGLTTVTCNYVTKPALIHDYNVCMGGVDKKDQMLALYPIERKRTMVWYKKFFRRLLNVSVLNAYIMFKANHQINHRSFRRTLVIQLLERHNTYKRRIGLVRQQSRAHLPSYFDYERTVAGSVSRRLRRKCAICSKRTTSYCAGCGDGKPLCLPECFAHQHR